MLDAQERELVRALLRNHGVTGPVRIVRQEGRDEIVIVLSSTAARIDEGPITQELQNALHRKVWIVTDEPVWDGQTDDL